MDNLPGVRERLNSPRHTARPAHKQCDERRMRGGTRSRWRALLQLWALLALWAGSSSPGPRPVDASARSDMGVATVTPGAGSIAPRRRAQESSPGASASGRVLVWGGDPQAAQGVPADLTTQAGGQAGPVQALAVGFRDQMVALLEDGAVRAWWSFGAWDVDLGPGVTGASQVTAGYNLGVALTRNGTVVAWQFSTSALEPLSVPPLAGVQRVACVAATQPLGGVLAVLANGSVAAWSYSSDWSTWQPWDLQMPSSVAQAVATVGVWQAVAGAQTRTLLLRNGTVLAFGGAAAAVVPDAARRDVVAVAVGAGHTLALTAQGRVLAFGDGSAGQTAVPAPVLRGNVTRVAAGWRSSVALLANGSVVAWGTGRAKLGTVPSDALSGVVAVAAGAEQLAAVTQAVLPGGWVVLWGEGSRVPPQLAALDARVVKVAAGGIETGDFIALLSNGSVRAWRYGERANASATAAAPPAGSLWYDELADVRDAQDVQAGDIHAVALLRSGRVRAWLFTADGLQPLALPARLSGQVATAVCAGGAELLGVQGVTMAVFSDGTRARWGYRQVNGTASSPGAPQGWSLAELDDVLSTAPPQVSTALASVGVAAFALGRDPFQMALLRNGTVVVWGSLVLNGQELVPVAATANVIAIAAGTGHCLALVRGGDVVAWGRNSENQAPAPAGLGQAVTIAAGPYHSLVLQRDGRVVAFGWNDFKQVDPVPANATKEVFGVAAGSRYSIALVKSSDDATFAFSPPPPPQPKPPPPRPPPPSPPDLPPFPLPPLPSPPPPSPLPVGLPSPPKPSRSAQAPPRRPPPSSSNQPPAGGASTAPPPSPPSSSSSAAPAADGAAIQAPPSPAASNGGSSSSAPIGAIVGGVVGGVALLAAMAAGLVVMSRRRRRSRSLAAGDGSGKGKPGAEDSVPAKGWDMDPSVSGAGAASAAATATAAVAVITVHTPRASAARMPIPDGGEPPGAAALLVAGGGESAAARSEAVAPQAGGEAASLPVSATALAAPLQLASKGANQGEAALAAGQREAVSPSSASVPSSQQASGRAAHAGGRSRLEIKGLIKGDPFLRGAAVHFGWAAMPRGAAYVPVQEGISAAQLDSRARPAAAAAGSAPGAPLSSAPSVPLPVREGVPKRAAAALESVMSAAVGAGTALVSPVVELSSAEVARELELHKDGLLGRGATALVFSCRWRSRFGPHGLLAAKVLRDPFEAEEDLKSFEYEARLLKDIRHPNVVQLYGFCLEPPTVCLVMELLPTSLRTWLTLQRPALHELARLWTPGGATAGAAASGGSQPRQASGLSSSASGADTRPDSAVASASSLAQAAAAEPGSHDGASHSDSDSAAAAAARRSSAPAPLSRFARTSGRRSSVPQLASGGDGEAEPADDAAAVSAAAPSASPGPPSQQQQQQQAAGQPRLDVFSSPFAAPQASGAARPGDAGRPPGSALTVAASEEASAEAVISSASNVFSAARRGLAPDSGPALQPCSLLDVLLIGRDVAAALAFLHQRRGPSASPSSSQGSQQHQADGGGAAGRRGRGPGGALAASPPGHAARQAGGRSNTWVVHRDLKPDNILFNASGAAKLSDFGLARLQDSTTLYSAHLAVGTLRYMAPELLEEQVSMTTNKIDVYSLGVMMWELATGELPWHGFTDLQLTMLVLRKQRPSLGGPGLCSVMSGVPTDHADAGSNSGGSPAAAARHLGQGPGRPQQHARPTSAAGASAASAGDTDDQATGGDDGDTAPRHWVQPSPPASSWSTATASAGSGRSAGRAQQPAGGAASSRHAPPVSRQGSLVHMQGAAHEIFARLPKYKALVSACWQHDGSRRPHAYAVLRQLTLMVNELTNGQAQPAAAPAPTLPQQPAAQPQGSVDGFLV